MATIIFKPTEQCNSNCLYCDVVAKKSTIKSMSIDLLKRFFKRVNEYLLKLPDEKVKITWHGGEPLLLGVDYFYKSLEFQNKYCAKTKNRISHCIQSNLTLINKDFLDAFKQLGMNGIGTSYEYISNIRGPGKSPNSDLYNRLFMKGISLLQENDFEWSFIYVTTRRALEKPLDVFHFLSNFKLNSRFVLHPVLIFGEDKHNIGITPKEFANFLGAIFSVWWKHRDRYPEVSPFSNFVKLIENNGIGLECIDSGRCALNHMYIGPSGEISHCGRSADWHLVSYGHIKKNSLFEAMKNKKRRQFLRRNEILPKSDCKGCRFWRICHGGCPLDAYDGYGDFLRKTKWCDTKKIFLAKYFEPITGWKF